MAGTWRGHGGDMVEEAEQTVPKTVKVKLKPTPEQEGYLIVPSCSAAMSTTPPLRNVVRHGRSAASRLATSSKRPSFRQVISQVQRRCRSTARFTARSCRTWYSG